jgi:hypothetical protein
MRPNDTERDLVWIASRGGARFAASFEKPMMRLPSDRVACVVVAIYLGLTILGSVGCDSSRTNAGDTLRRTVPEGDSEPALAGPVWSGQSAQFTWDFETHLDAMAYTAWLAERLRDFEIVTQDSGHVLLRKYRDGDSYRIQLVLDNMNGRTRVHATLNASPD